MRRLQELFAINFNIDGNLHQAAIYDSQGFDNNAGIMFIPLFKRYTAFIIVYDITNKNSFQNAKQCIDQIRQLCPLENQYILVLGNKDDLEEQREVQIKPSMKYFSVEGIEFQQVSAKTSSSDQLKKIFENKLRLLIAKRHAKNNFPFESRLLKKKQLLKDKQLSLSTTHQNINCIANSHAENILTSESRLYKKYELLNDNQLSLSTTHQNINQQLLLHQAINLERHEQTIILSIQNIKSKSKWFNCCLLI